jgi:hypothetical protein
MVDDTDDNVFDFDNDDAGKDNFYVDYDDDQGRDGN